jgi:predicted phosphoribosyltransferase
VLADGQDACERLVKKLLSLRNAEATEEEEQRYIEKHYDDIRIVVLAIARGGVIIGDLVASDPDAKLHLVASKKFGYHLAWNL